MTPQTPPRPLDAPESTEVTANARVEGQPPCEPTLKSLEAITSCNIVMRNGDRGCEMSLGTPENEGMTFLSQVEVPDGCSGTLEYVQLVDYRRELRDQHNNSWCMKGTGALDTRDPKDVEFAYPGIVKFKSTDNPGSGVEGDVYHSAEDQFKLWLLWRPDPPTPPGMLWPPIDSPPLPRIALAMVSWDWKAKTNKTGDSGDCQADWTISDDYAHGGTGVVTKEMPAYTENVSDKVFSRGTC